MNKTDQIENTVTDMQMEGGSASAGTAEKEGGTCCCGCSLRCAVVTFGVLNIIGFFINLATFLVFYLVTAAVIVTGRGFSIDVTAF